MSYRFKASKYKNATPKVPKKMEGWILDVSVGSPQCFGNNIKASAAFMAFSTDTRGGGSLAVLSLDDAGRKNKAMPLLHAHAEMITDFDFSPFDDGLLITGSQDRYAKLWRIRSKGGIAVDLPSNPELVLPPFQNRIESLLFHPSVDNLLVSGHGGNVTLWDLVNKTQISSHNNHSDVIQSISWKGDGSLLISSGRDKILNIWDPRAQHIAQECTGHQNQRDSRILWLGDSNVVLSTGFGYSREREAAFRDVRKLDQPLSSILGESSLGILIPLYDQDTKMLFMAAKADTTVYFYEVLDSDPYYTEGAIRFSGEVQVKGVGLVPKRALPVMTGEVNRVLLLGSDCVVPIKYIVPRKSYRDFHPDLYPDTYGAEPSMTMSDWMDGRNIPISKITLDPMNKPPGGLLKQDRILGSAVIETLSKSLTSCNKPNNPASRSNSISGIPSPAMLRRSQHSISRDWEGLVDTNSDIPKPSKPPKPLLGPKPFVSTSKPNGDSCQKSISPEVPPSSSVTPGSPNVILRRSGQAAESTPSQPRRSRFSVRVTKFRHLNGDVGRKETHITNLCKLSKAVPGECDVFQVNCTRAAIPLAGEGGHLAILELSKRGRMQSGVVPSIICGTTVMDFAWDPFDPKRLAVACDDGTIQIWVVPEDGLNQSITDPKEVLNGHTEKVQMVKFHPTASDVLASASHDLTICIWDLVTKQQKILLSGHIDQIFSIAWSPDGKYLASVCKDQKLRIFEPRSSEDAIREGPGPQGSRGARVIWVMGGSHLVTTGFSRVSERLINLYDAKDLSMVLATEGLDVSPSILVPYYDEDSSTLFMTGRGDSTVYAFEVARDGICFHPLSHYKCSGPPHQAVAFLPKNACDVTKVEFAKSFRLTPTTIEPLTFSVPRLRKEFFQDDLFPETRVTWESVLSSDQWFSGSNKESKRISLRPDGMSPLSEAPSVNKHKMQEKNKPEIRMAFEGEMTLESSLAFLHGNKQKEERIIRAMTDKLNYEGQNLPQDSYEGVDPNEWEDESNPRNQT